jgi:hypothetical protein
LATVPDALIWYFCYLLLGVVFNKNFRYRVARPLRLRRVCLGLGEQLELGLWLAETALYDDTLAHRCRSLSCFLYDYIAAARQKRYDFVMRFVGLVAGPCRSPALCGLGYAGASLVAEYILLKRLVRHVDHTKRVWVTLTFLDR